MTPSTIGYYTVIDARCKTISQHFHFRPIAGIIIAVGQFWKIVLQSASEKRAMETQSNPEPVWTFRGYTMRPGEFNTAMVHFYRAEIQRANTWRNRLDATTNWAILTASAVITFALSDEARHHAIILFALGLLGVFWFIEARRYRYYELWSFRTRLLETDFFAAMLVPPFAPSPTWAETLADSLLHPHFTISMWEALGRRLRRNYFAIFCVMLVVWVFKILSQPTPATSWTQVVQRAYIGPVSGEIVVAVVALMFGALCVLAIATLGLQQAAGEVLPTYPQWLRRHLPHESDD
jgi:uncharacterized membrane protein